MFDSALLMWPTVVRPWTCCRPSCVPILFPYLVHMQPSEDEARSAMYNMGCALAKQKQWARAADCVMEAINKHQLKLTVALKVNRSSIYVFYDILFTLFKIKCRLFSSSSQWHSRCGANNLLFMPSNYVPQLLACAHVALGQQP